MRVLIRYIFSEKVTKIQKPPLNFWDQDEVKNVIGKRGEIQVFTFDSKKRALILNYNLSKNKSFFNSSWTKLFLIYYIITCLKKAVIDKSFFNSSWTKLFLIYTYLLVKYHLTPRKCNIAELLAVKFSVSHILLLFLWKLVMGERLCATSCSLHIYV